MSAAKRIRQAVVRSAALRRMVWERVREAHPGASPSELHRAFAERWLGRGLAAKVYGKRTH
jgi:hypothetical protein